MQTATRNVQRVVTEMQQRIQRRISQDPDVAAPASIAARGSAARDEFLAAKGSHAVTAVTSLYANFYAIDEHTENTLRSNESGNFIFESEIVRLEISNLRFESILKSKMRAR
jgi:hypothetical protein